MAALYKAGIDAGSTTVKIALCDPAGDTVFARYLRHHSKTLSTIRAMLAEVLDKLGNVRIDLAVTGSAGMGVAESFHLPFIQEVVASAKLIKQRWPDVRTLIEIGGEDSKVAFFDDRFQPDIRMNGNCAGGTGAFIEQMAVLLNEPLNRLDELAQRSQTVYPIASRCGVFAKTDVQTLLSNRVAKEDIAASVFHAMAIQVISTLSRGHDIDKKVIFAGGPLTFFRSLREAFLSIFKLDPEKDLAVSDHPEIMAAEGAALCHDNGFVSEVEECIHLFDHGKMLSSKENETRLAPLFGNPSRIDEWEQGHGESHVERVEVSDLKGEPCFLGIDSGSTTTKLVLIDQHKRVALKWYDSNKGDAISAVRKGLSAFKEDCVRAGVLPEIVRSAVTGYGEDLIKAAFSFDDGVVETVAHYRAARHFLPEVSFILDIGGQDMKAIYVVDGGISDIQINEACSSGCGTFIETLADSLKVSVNDFARLACRAPAPFNLGTRCTVFMNSRVKQALREGATIADISAGLAYSVIGNTLYKVLKLHDPSQLGDHIVVQGGTFRNPAVLRAFELEIGHKVIRPDISEMMGAYGAALTALENYLANPSLPTTFPGLNNGSQEQIVGTTSFHCGGCENHCKVSKVVFSGGRTYFTGNRCENYFSNRGDKIRPGENLFATRLKLAFEQPTEPAGKEILTFGIPRVLNMFENFPFWAHFLTSCGFRIVLSSLSDMKLYEKGVRTVMSDNICFPGKLAHGHIIDLLEKRVDRIFYPIVVYESQEFPEAVNSFNCPVVTGYPDVIRSSIDPEGRYGIPLDSPAISFKDIALLKKQLYHFFKRYGVSQKTVSASVDKGIQAQNSVRAKLQHKAALLIEKARRENRFAVVVAGRPYHLDPLINHGLPEMLAGLGVDVIPESAIMISSDRLLDDVKILSQWAYTNRILAVAKTIAEDPNLEIVQLTSFGCGVDAISTDEVADIIRQKGKVYTLIKMDEISNLGAVRIRLRSMLEVAKERLQKSRCQTAAKTNAYTALTKPEDRNIIIPWFSPFYSPAIPAVFRSFGYNNVEILMPQDRSSVDVGLRYVNNDVCYPAIIVVGDIIKAMQSGKWDPKKTTVILTQTFGQCRASSYLPLTQKALAAAGFPEVPVVSLSVGESMHLAGIPIDQKKLVKRLALGLIFTDPLAKMAMATMPHEIKPGSTMALHKKYLEEVGVLVCKDSFEALLEMLKMAVHDFNTLPVYDGEVPAVGVLGEIFVKHNEFANNNIVDWFTSQGIEVVVPPLLAFFEQVFVNGRFDQQAFMKRSVRDRVVLNLVENYVGFYLGRVEKVMRSFKYYRKTYPLKDLAREAARVTSLANQAGEGWLLPAEIISLFKQGIENIVCLQPFGCLANHIIGKGVEKRLKALYPNLNLLYIDMDAGITEVNVLNRLHLMVMSLAEDRKQRVMALGN